MLKLILRLLSLLCPLLLLNQSVCIFRFLLNFLLILYFIVFVFLCSLVIHNFLLISFILFLTELGLLWSIIIFTLLITSLRLSQILTLRLCSFWILLLIQSLHLLISDCNPSSSSWHPWRNTFRCLLLLSWLSLKLT